MYIVERVKFRKETVANESSSCIPTRTRRNPHTNDFFKPNDDDAPKTFHLRLIDKETKVKPTAKNITWLKTTVGTATVTLRKTKITKRLYYIYEVRQ